MSNNTPEHIILLDREGNLLSYIMEHTDFHIATLVCEYQPKVKELLAAYPHRIKHILDYQNLLEIQHTTHISQDLIQDMRSIQIDVETMLHRVMLNNPLAKDIYYQYLSFFAEVFEKHKISFVLNAEMILSSPHHLIPFGLASLYNIPAYSLDSVYDEACLFHFNTRSPIIFEAKDKPHSLIRDRRFHDYETGYQDKRGAIQDRIIALLYKVGGHMLVEFAACIQQMSFTRKYMGIEYSYFSKLRSLMQHKKMHRFYKKVAISPDLNEKFIYFNLHLEPEAAVIGRAKLEAQLTMIKMIANALPKGWKIYVKEHPHQLLFNDALTHYFLHNVAFFKNIEFYKSIMNIPNTTLVSLDVHAKDLIKHAQAIATFDGTVTIEAISFQTPVMLFNPKPTPYQHLSHTLHIYSFNDLKQAMDKIQAGFPHAINEEEEFKKLEAYFSYTNDPHFFTNLLTTITNHIKERQTPKDMPQ